MREKVFSINESPDERSSVAQDFDFEIREGLEPLQKDSVNNFHLEDFVPELTRETRD